jgi:hypothetical protein
LSFRSGLALGVVAAVLASLPALIRLLSAGAPALAFLSLIGGAALALGPLVALGRQARPLNRGLLACLAGVGFSLPVLSVLGRLIEQKTHHRPLGAATFAVLALIIVLGASIVLGRALSLASSRRPAGIALGLAGGLTVLVAAQAFTGGGSFRASVVDAAAVCSVAVLAIALPVTKSLETRLHSLALPLWGLLALAGVVLSRTTAGGVVGGLAPVLAPLNGW